MLATNNLTHDDLSFPLSFAQVLDWSRAPNWLAGAEDGIRTRDPLLGKEMLYR